MALFVCAHVGVMFDWEGNKQQLLQGHVSCITVFIHVDLNLKPCLRSYEYHCLTWYWQDKHV